MFVKKIGKTVKGTLVLISIVAATACGAVLPARQAEAQPLTLVQPSAKQAQVKHRYKTFTSGLFVDPEYDVQYKIYTFNNELIYLGDTMIDAYAGNYTNGVAGIIAQYECRYQVS